MGRLDVCRDGLNDGVEPRFDGRTMNPSEEISGADELIDDEISKRRGANEI